MNMKNIFCCLLPGLLFGACANKGYEETGDSVIVKVQQEVTGGPRLVRLQVMGDKLIRVSATADSKFADPQSLIVVPQEKQIPFAVMQNGDTITVSTEEVKASVLASTGEVWFADKDGKLILQENKGGGKTFTPIEVEGTKGYTVCQVFESPEDEAASIRRMNLIIRVRTKNCSSTIRKFLFRLLFRIKTMVYCWIVIPSVVSVIRMITPS